MDPRLDLLALSLAMALLPLQCLVWILGVVMMIFLFAEGKQDIEPMPLEKLEELRNRKRA